MGILRQIVVDVQPADFAAGPNMIGGRDAVGVVEAGEGEIKCGRLGFAAKKQLRAAMAAEFAPAVCPRCKMGGFALAVFKAAARHGGPGLHRRAGGMLAQAAMAIAGIDGHVQHAVADAAAQAAAEQGIGHGIWPIRFHINPKK